MVKNSKSEYRQQVNSLKKLRDAGLIPKNTSFKLEKGETKEKFKKMIDSINSMYKIPHQQEAKRLTKVKAKRDIKKDYIGDINKESFNSGKKITILQLTVK